MEHTVQTRKLTSDEISSLERQGCFCNDWKTIDVDTGFNSSSIRNVYFSGKIQLGKFQNEVTLAGGIKSVAGLSNCLIHNCNIGNNAYIANVKKLANYEIGNDVIIENVESIIVEGVSTFGNGAQLDIVNEAGGRTLKIFDKLSANLAYFIVFYRHNKNFTQKLESLVDEYVENKKSSKGKICEGAAILNSGSLTNVEVGKFAIVSGVSNLKDGTIASCREDPAFVGSNVIAKNFIILSGSVVDDGAILHQTFIGQGVKIGKQFSAENSAFFANSEAFHGEACSVFGGPYTVTHHKSSLLIAGLYSFYNAGSGTNQSNHMYKLGPVHQGIIERGSKTGSFSYMLWPSKVGPFSTVIGKHYVNFDTSNLPFSYINEEDGKSYVIPSITLFTVGTRRDSQKWKTRDRRKDPVKLDIISFELFNPYTVGKMVSASDELNHLYENTPKEKNVIYYKGINLRRLLLKTACKYYEMGIKIFIGNCVVKKLENISEDASFDTLKKQLKADTTGGLNSWIDIAGLLAPASSINKLVNDVENNKYNTVDEVYNSLTAINNNFDIDEWNWCAALIEKRFSININEITPEIIKTIIEEWKSNRVRLNNMIIRDAEKEFDPSAMIGYGINGGSEIIKQDFEAVRGTAESNSFISGLKKESKEVEELNDKIINILQKYPGRI